jgi:hypothetical protein
MMLSTIGRAWNNQHLRLSAFKNVVEYNDEKGSEALDVSDSELTRLVRAWDKVMHMLKARQEISLTDSETKL